MKNEKYDLKEFEKQFVNITGNIKKSIDKNMLKTLTKKYLDQLVKIKNMHEQILDSIKMGISILINSLDISKHLEEEKPIPKFLSKEFNNIVNSWLFIKLDFENFNLTKTINSSNIDNDFKEFLYKVCQNKNFIMGIGAVKTNDESLNAFDYEEIQKQESILITENYKNLTKMKVNKIRNADIPFNLDDNCKNFPKLRYLKFNNCSFSEKADKKILDKFLQILEDGRLTDGKGETVYFSETIIIFTSNIGASKVSPGLSVSETRKQFISEVKNHFVRELGRPELLNRIGDNIVAFNFISDPADAFRVFPGGSCPDTFPGG